VRALCASEIAVFDVTGYQSAMMLLLGIRSVVRRGVTVVVTQDESRVVHFNIASLNPLSVAGDLVGDLAKAFESGFAGLVASGDRYLDLPAYDPVRALGGDYRIRAPETEILMLRWFDDQYEKTVGDPIVRSHLEDTYKSADIITTLDSDRHSWSTSVSMRRSAEHAFVSPTGRPADPAFFLRAACGWP
jgi:hypothetical protein